MTFTISSVDGQTNPSAEILDADLAELYQRHQLMLAASAEWIEVWRMLLESDTFMSICQSSANTAMRQCGLTSDCEADMMQQSLVYFAAIVRKRTSLGFVSAKGQYRNWLWTMMYGCARKSVRQFRERTFQQGDLAEVVQEDHSIELAGLQMDLVDIIAQLDKPISTALRLYWQGKSIGEIANTIKRSERTVYRMLKRGLLAVSDDRVALNPGEGKSGGRRR